MNHQYLMPLAYSRQNFSVTFDALLVGHEAGITALAWQLPQNATPSSQESQLTLLSTSSDSSVIIWSPSPIVTAHPDASSAIWVNRQRFGDVGGQRLGGFVGGLWACSGRDILAWGWAGGWRRWHCEASDEDSAETWTETGAISGHAGPVRGIAWSPGGEYLISVGFVLLLLVSDTVGRLFRLGWIKRLGFMLLFQL